MTQTTDYQRPKPGRKYIEALTAHEIALREAARDYAREHYDVIKAAQTIRCTAQESRYKHLIDNNLTCARCGITAATILDNDQ